MHSANSTQKFPIVIPRALVTRFRPSWKALVAYSVLSYSAGDRSLQVGTKQLAEMFSISEMTLRRGIRELTKLKLIKIKHHKSKKNGKTVSLPNEYILVELQSADTDAI